MANGYLGKISAVVSANTADFDAKLNRSAKEVQSFASRVQGNLTSASRAAAKSLEGIYTPLQRFERSLQAAATMKLSFKGFPGMIRDVDTLQQRLNSVLSKRQLDIVLKTTGMRDITSVREALFGLKSKDVEVIARVGGLEKLNQLREQMRSDATVMEVRANVDQAKARVAEIGKQIAEAQEAGGEIAVGVDIAALQASLKTAEAEVEKTERKLAKTTKVKFGVDADLATLDAVAAKAEKAGDILGKLPLLMSKLGQSDFTAAADKMRQMMSVTEGITKPLESAATALGGLSKEMQAAYKPAAESAQKSTEQLKATIDRLGGATDSLAGKSLEKYFEAVRSKADQTTASVERLKQVTASIGQTKTGSEFVFEQPRLSQAIARGADIGSRAAALPAEAIAVNPEIAKSLAEIRRLSDEAGVAYARFLSLKDQRLSTTEAQADLDSLVKELLEVQSVAERQIKVSTSTAAADNELALIQRREQAAKAAELERQAQAQKAADSEIANLIRVQQAAKAAELERQAPAQKAAAEAKKSVDAIKQSLRSIVEKDFDLSLPIERLRRSYEKAREAIERLPAGPVKTKLEEDYANERSRIFGMSGPDSLRPPARELELLTGSFDAMAETAAAAGPQKPAVNPLGADFGTAERQVASLQSAVQSLQGSLEKLPMPMQVQFIPAINKVRAAFQGLSTSSTQAEIDAVTKKAAGLERALTRAGQASRLGTTLGESLNDAALGKVEKQIGFIRSKLLEVGAAASGPVADAFNKYAAAAANAAKSGTAGLPAVQKQLDDLIEKLVEAAVATGTLDAKQAQAFKKSVGDVGRGGADKFALAMNQAAFAIDDFMSSTGGLEFKLRAVSNNITQLAFIVGGTTGLFIGLGAVMAGQLAIGIAKFVNGGRSAEDQTKALNDALARQKSLVEELAQAFKSLGDSLSRGTFSAVGEQARDFERQLREIAKKQDELARKSVADFDPEVIRERAEQNRLRGRIEKSTDAGEVRGLQVKLEESQRREREATERAAAAPPPDLGAIQDRLRESLRAEAVAAARDAGAASPDDINASFDAARPLLERAEAVGRPGSIAEARGQVRNRISELSQQVEGGLLDINQVASAKKEIAELQAILGSLSAPMMREISAAANEIAQASRAPAEQIRQAQEEVAEAIKLGIPGARRFQQQLDENAKTLESAFEKLKQAQEGKDELGNPITDAQAKARVDAARAEIADLENNRANIINQTNALAYERIVDPQQEIDARMGRARENLGAAGLEDGRLARRMREIDAEREKIRRDSAIPGNDNAAFQKAATVREVALNSEAAAIEAATMAIRIFAAALDKASEEVGGNLTAAQQAADEARRADLAKSTPQTREARRQAEDDLRRQREIERRARKEIAVERDRLELTQRADQDRLQQINNKLLSGSGTEQEREELIREREAIRGRMEDQARASQGRVDKITDISTREEERRKAANRGREMTIEPDERFRRETEQGLADIQEYFGRLAAANGGLSPVQADDAVETEKRFLREREREARTATAAGRGRELAMTERERFRRDMEEGVVADLTAAAEESQDPAGLLRQGIANQMESIAPMLQQFAEERQNALLQGPSRAALNVADVSTSQGASELTRLLRGDDSAKDVNLVELQKQTQKFDDLIAAVKAANPGVLL